MEIPLDLVDLGKATVETRQRMHAPIFFDGVSWQYYSPQWE
jgi:hypothetical protein